jgi:(4S)-4-hydroxy-5-phosphonooxypentane-2,3-dione isomerase
MYVVIVDFTVKREFFEQFRAAMVGNARASFDREPGCRQFDVCVAPEDPATIFLYEVYDDQAAFDAHLATPHFLAFNQMTSPWIADKRVRTLQRIEPPGT